MKTINIKFVEYIPEQLKENTLYVAMELGTVMHNCFCGCKSEVITPLSPTDWEIKYNGDTLSLYPSIGNWSFPCRSHYWITESKVIWSTEWSQTKIDKGRQQDRIAKEGQYIRKEKVSQDIRNHNTGFLRKWFNKIFGEK